MWPMLDVEFGNDNKTSEPPDYIHVLPANVLNLHLQ